MMRVSIITPNFNGARFLEESVRSVHAQAHPGLEVEHIVIDAASTDGSMKILDRYRPAIRHLISEPDRGPASAINKGFRLATGDVIGWLNADDRYRPDALRRATEALARRPDKALCFGHCPIVDETGNEIRQGITRFKEAFFPVSCRAAIQSINYISQPTALFRRSAVDTVGLLREDMKYAWDYEFILRMWRQGGGLYVPGPALAEFRWHPASLSGQGFVQQFQEELEAAIADAGRYSIQALLHRCVRWGIVTIYGHMARQRQQEC